jgi:hypothetical protein
MELYRPIGKHAPGDECERITALATEARHDGAVPSARLIAPLEAVRRRVVEEWHVRDLRVSKPGSSDFKL